MKALPFANNARSFANNFRSYTGAVRFRPMLLTAMAVVVGASVILFDPIFQGLAISLMAGEIASLFISRMAVPVLYFMAYKHRKERLSSAPRPEGDRPDHSLKTEALDL